MTAGVPDRMRIMSSPGNPRQTVFEVFRISYSNVSVCRADMR